MTRKKILLVSPDFHSYWQAISAALEACGYEVVVHRYDFVDSLGQRLANKLLHELPQIWTRRLSQAQTTRAISVLLEAQPDYLLVVKGDVFEDQWWEAIRESNVPVSLWLYDELGNMRFSIERLKSIDRIASYSSQDVKHLALHGISALHVPDGFDSLLEFTPRPTHAVSFVGARYSSREEILRAIAGEKVPLVAYGRSWSRHPWDVLRTSSFVSPGIASGRDLSRADYYAVMAGSIATLNLHGAHTGFNMRAFEAPGVGALQLIDRPDINEYFEPGSEVLVFEAVEQVGEYYRRAQKDPVWASKIRRAGQQRALAEHTMIHRVKLLETLWR